MSIMIDASKLVSIQLFYVEDEGRNGSSTFHFIRSQSDMDSWKSRDYITQEEYDLKAKDTPSEPGMPQQATPDSTKVISSIITYWSRMSWKEQNSTYSRCLKQITGSDGVQRTVLDSILFRDAKLKICLKKWDVKGADGQEVPITEMAIDSLVPEVATELLSNFEKVTEASEEDLKN